MGSHPGAAHGVAHSCTPLVSVTFTAARPSPSAPPPNSQCWEGCLVVMMMVVVVVVMIHVRLPASLACLLDLGLGMAVVMWVQLVAQWILRRARS
ncbi:hypothetical protein V8C86DRAFT_2592385 [Haematococcus lacustris]